LIGRVVTRNASVHNLCDVDIDMRDISIMIILRMDIVTLVFCRQNMSVVLQIGIVYVCSFDTKRDMVGYIISI